MQTFDFLGSKIFFPVANGGKVPELGMYLTSAGNIAFAIGGVNVFEIDADGSIIPGNLGALVLALRPYYAVEPPEPVEFTATPHVMAASEYEAIKNVAGSAAVTLPLSPVKGQIACVGDMFGDLVLDTVSLTVTAGANSGAGTINGQAQHTMWRAWQRTMYRYNGTEWNVVCSTFDGSIYLDNEVNAVGAGNVGTPIITSHDAIVAANSVLDNPTRTTEGVAGNLSVNGTTAPTTKAMRGVHGRVTLKSTNTQDVTVQGLVGVLGEVVTDTGAVGNVTASASALQGAIQNPAAGVSVTNAYGLLLSTLGAGGGGTITNLVGSAIAQIAGAVNRVSMLLGTLVAPAGNFAIYDQTGDPSVFSGAVRAGAFTVATLPAALEGSYAYVTDGAGALAWGDVVVGGGASKYLVFYNGTSWTVAGK